MPFAESLKADVDFTLRAHFSLDQGLLDWAGQPWSFLGP